MKRSLAIDASKKVGEEVRLEGFVDSIRDHGKITFIDLRDRSAIIQCVGQSLPDTTVESVVEIIGNVAERPEKLVNPDLPTGKVEIQINELNVLSRAQEIPIPLNERAEDEASAQKRFDVRWLDLRRTENKRIFEVWTAMEKGFREHFYANDYIQIYTPSLMKSASESGSEVFKVDYFGAEAFLAQSPQFYKQLAMAAGFEKVFMVGPVFRAEPSYTTRHMTEFTGWDFEISYIDSHNDVMDEEEQMLIKGFKAVNKDLDMSLEIPEAPFPRIPLLEVKKRLAEKGVKSEKEFDISPEEEREISDIIKKETGSDFLFVTDWPAEARPFYHMRHEDNPKLTKSFDLLYKGVEVTTGAQREHRIDALEKQAKEKNINLDDISYYLDFFRYGCPPHGGGGIGPGRIIMKALDLKSVKEATFLPRDVKRISP